jgi:hypothetical protein
MFQMLPYLGFELVLCLPLKFILIFFCSVLESSHNLPQRLMFSAVLIFVSATVQQRFPLPQYHFFDCSCNYQLDFPRSRCASRTLPPPPQDAIKSPPSQDEIKSLSCGSIRHMMKVVRE